MGEEERGEEERRRAVRSVGAPPPEACVSLTQELQSGPLSRGTHIVSTAAMLVVFHRRRPPPQAG